MRYFASYDIDYVFNGKSTQYVIISFEFLPSTNLNQIMKQI